jgi:hypothetical protein
MSWQPLYDCSLPASPNCHQIGVPELDFELGHWHVFESADNLILAVKLDILAIRNQPDSTSRIGHVDAPIGVNGHEGVFSVPSPEEVNPRLWLSPSIEQSGQTPIA